MHWNTTLERQVFWNVKKISPPLCFWLHWNLMQNIKMCWKANMKSNATHCSTIYCNINLSAGDASFFLGWMKIVGGWNVRLSVWQCWHSITKLHPQKNTLHCTLHCLPILPAHTTAPFAPHIHGTDYTQCTGHHCILLLHWSPLLHTTTHAPDPSHPACQGGERNNSSGLWILPRPLCSPPTPPSQTHSCTLLGVRF